MTLNQKTNISIFISTISVVLIVVFAIYPLFQEIRKNSKELISQKEGLLVLENKMNDLEQFKIIYKGLAETLKGIDNSLADSEVPIDFISFLENGARMSKLSIEISPGPIEKNKKGLWDSLNFQITAQGVFPDFLKFLKRLENGPYLIEIKNINISISKSESKEVKISFPLKVFAR